MILGPIRVLKTIFGQIGPKLRPLFLLTFPAAPPFFPSFLVLWFGLRGRNFGRIDPIFRAMELTHSGKSHEIKKNWKKFQTRKIDFSIFGTFFKILNFSKIGPKKKFFFLKIFFPWIMNKLYKKIPLFKKK